MQRTKNEGGDPADGCLGADAFYGGVEDFGEPAVFAVFDVGEAEVFDDAADDA